MIRFLTNSGGRIPQLFVGEQNTPDTLRVFHNLGVAATTWGPHKFSGTLPLIKTFGPPKYSWRFCPRGVGRQHRKWTWVEKNPPSLFPRNWGPTKGVPPGHRYTVLNFAGPF